MSKDTKGLRTELVGPPTFTDQGEEGKPGRETEKHGQVRGGKKGNTEMARKQIGK